MKSKVIKIIVILTAILAIFSNYSVHAVKDVLEDPDFFRPGIATEEPELQEKAGKVLGIVNTVGVIVSVISLMIIGIKYMLGSLEEKAEYKKTMLVYIIGAILLFSATTIPNILYKIGTSLGDEPAATGPVVPSKPGAGGPTQQVR